MHRRLLLMRHAKSSWKQEGMTDHDRPLNKRGRKNAPAMAHAIEALDWMPEVVLSSDSTRTRETWERMASVWPSPPPIRFRNDLYLAPMDVFRTLISRQNGDVSTLMVLSHNPGCENILRWFTGALFEPMTTANVALMTAETATWADAVDEPRRFSLVDVLRPRDPRS